MDGKYPFLSPFTYVMNSPLNSFDPNGKIVIWLQVETRLQFVVSFSFSYGIAIDHKGNIGLYLGGALGGGYGVGAYGGITGGMFPGLSTTIYDVEGWGIDVGGYLGAGYVKSYEGNMSIGNGIKFSFQDPTGLTSHSFGAGAGVYGQISNLDFTSKWNIFKLMANNFKGFKTTAFYKLLKSLGFTDKQIQDYLKDIYKQAKDLSFQKVDDENQENSDESEDEKDDQQSLEFNDPWNRFSPKYR